MSVAEQYKALLEINARDTWKEIEVTEETEDEVRLTISVTDQREPYSHLSKAAEILAEALIDTGVMPLLSIRYLSPDDV